MNETCDQCGSTKCGGVHICASCGRNAPTPLMVDGKFYCDTTCLHNAEPAHTMVSDLDKKRADLIGRMRALKVEADAAGITWIN